jgi:hypothetical protein
LLSEDNGIMQDILNFSNSAIRFYIMKFTKIPWRFSA